MSAGDTFHTNVLIQTEIELLFPKVRTLALILPVFPKNKPLTNNQVDLLVITKEAFSLRFDGNFKLNGSDLRELDFSVSENNLAGTNKAAAFQFSLRPYLLTLLARYADPNFLNAGLEFSVDQGLILDRASGQSQGSQGSMQLQYPLDSQQTSWGYQFNFDYLYTPRFVMDKDRAKEKYQWLKINGHTGMTRSFGGNSKNNLTWGYGFSYQKPTLLSEEFKKTVSPVKEFQSFLSINYDYFWNYFDPLHNYNTFLLQEWIPLGPKISLTNDFGIKFLFSDENFWRPHFNLSFTFLPIHDSLMQLSLQGETRWQSQFVNSQIKTKVLLVSPQLFGIGRLLFNSVYGKKWNDLNKSSFTLGGNLLRGLVPEYYSGTNIINTNVEFRSISLPVGAFRLGGVLFYDFGAAFDEDVNFQLSHALGIGARIFYLPLSRSVFRIDMGVPVAGPKSGFKNTVISFGVDQAF